MPSRVAILVSSNWETGVSGVGTFLRLIIPVLRERFDLTVIPVGSGNSQGASAAGGPLSPVACPRPPVPGAFRLLLGYIRDAWRTYRQLREYKDRYDIVICNQFGAETLPIAARRAFPAAKLVCISHTHPGESTEAQHLVRRFVERLSCRTPHVIVFNSAALKKTWEDRLRQKLPDSKVIWHGIPEPDRSIPDDYPEKKTAHVDFAYLAQFYPWKGQCEFLDAWKLAVESSGTDNLLLPRLILVGDGARMKEAIRMTKDLGIENSVVFLGRKPDGARYLNKADVLLLMSRESEAFGFVLLEAMSRSVPVLATDKGGPKEILAEGGGITADPMDREAVAAAIKQMLDENTRRSIGAQGKIAYDCHFRSELMSSNYIRYLEEL